jgi:hypothetical protein
MATRKQEQKVTKMGRIFMAVLATAMLFALATQGATAAGTDQARLDVTLLSYTPVPVQPGSYVTVTLKIVNNGEGATGEGAIELVDNYPFSVEDQMSKMKTFSDLGSQETFLVEYRVRVDSAALEGENYLKVRYATSVVKNDWVEKTLSLSVDSDQNTISINDVTIDPEILSPGEKADVTIRIKNLANSDVRDVSMRLNLAGVLVGTSYIDIPLAPIGSSTEKSIPLLKGGQSADFLFVLQAYPAAEAGIYKIPVILAYTDEAGSEQTHNDIISVVVSGEPDIMVQVDSSTVYADNGKGEVIVAVTNKGFSEVKFTTVKLGTTGEYDLLSPSDELYLGNIESDDYQTAEFSIKPKAGAKSVKLPVSVTFKDALNKEHTVEKELTLPLLSTADAGNKRSPVGGIIAVIVVAGIVGLVAYNKGKKKAARK